ncbi:MAG: hypothetical protein ACT4TC_08105 [Myxococcaceae bacterium]
MSLGVTQWLRAKVWRTRLRGLSRDLVGKPLLPHETPNTPQALYFPGGENRRIGFVSGVEEGHGSAQPCWKGLTEGFAENYGRPDNAENFSETLNHALDRAVSKLLMTEDFEAALCGVCG